MVFCENTKGRILYYFGQGHKPYSIAKLLKKEGIRASKFGVSKFLTKYKETGTTVRKTGSGRPSKIAAEVNRLVDAKMSEDDETTATQLH